MWKDVFSYLSPLFFCEPLFISVLTSIYPPLYDKMRMPF